MNDQKNNNNEPNPIQVIGFKTQLIARMAWGLLILFGMVGTLVGERDQALIVFVVSSVVWCCLRIILEALDAYSAWGILFNEPKQEKDDNNNNGDPPIAS